MHLRSLCVAAVLAMAAPAAAGTVSGKLELPPGPPERPPVRGKAFVDRTPNPLTPVRPVDPLPSIIIALEPAPTTQYTPPPPAAVIWDLLGESFTRPVFPVRVGGEVLIRNKGRSSPVLVAAGQPQLLVRKPLNPTAELLFIPGTAPGPVEIVDETSPHLRGRLVVMPSPFFAVPNARGEFEVPAVPPGEWVIKVWYDTGWLDRPDERITVPAGDKKTEVTLKLPARWPIKAGRE
ncbi:MAG: hypothetical protein HS111_40200 [Kofleriaceae bacterium]|nr:hypothetical protein [Kofleriaceae bacterium]MCL4225013.1 hypothetical protein [Myxococcales bacterium]